MPYHGATYSSKLKWAVTGMDRLSVNHGPCLPHCGTLLAIWTHIIHAIWPCQHPKHIVNTGCSFEPKQVPREIKTVILSIIKLGFVRFA